MRTIQLPSKIEVAGLIGQPAKPEHVTIVYEIQEDTRLVDNEGQPLAFVSRVMPKAQDMRHLLLQIKFGKDNRTDGLVTNSHTFGALPRNTIRRDFCCQGALIATDNAADRALKASACDVAAAFKSIDPDLYEHHVRTISDAIKPDWRMAGGCYTSGIVNRDSTLNYHRDSQNFPDLWSGMITFRRSIQGGSLAMPEYRIAINLPDCSVIYFQGQKVIHGVLPFARQTLDGYRLTVVYYAMQPLRQCGTVKDELRRIQVIKTNRTRARALSVSMLKELDLKSLPKCPIFIPSRGRPSHAYSARSLKGAEVPFKLVIEPQEVESYRAIWSEKQILILPEGHQGIAYSRQFILDHCRSHGIPRYWQLDDNIRGWMVKLNGNLTIVPVNYVLSQIEAETESDARIAMAATDYKQFAALTNKEFTDNTRTYCCVLTRTDTGIDYRAAVEMKEDVDFCLRHLTTGWRTRLYHKFAMDKLTMGKTVIGGLSEKYKAGQDTTAAERLCAYWPGITHVVKKKNGKIDVKVDWNAITHDR